MPKTQEQCDNMRKAMKEKIIQGAMQYLARKGFAGTKISQLAQYIGIGQGTLYSYFSSKEELFKVIIEEAVTSNEKALEELLKAPFKAREKIILLSKAIMQKLNDDSSFSEMFVLNMRLAMEEGECNVWSNLYQGSTNKILGEIIRAGQGEGDVVDGESEALADFYWSSVHLFALKKVFSKDHQTFSEEQLIRILLKDK